MIESTLELLGHYCRETSVGLNAIVQALPRDKFGGLTEWPEPPEIPVIDTIQEPEAAHPKVGPSELPCVLLWADNGGGTATGGASNAKDVALLCSYVTDSGADPATSAALSGLYMRAALILFARFNEQSVSNAFRELNGVRILYIASLAEHDVVIPTDGRIKYWKLVELHPHVVDTLVAPRALRLPVSA